MEAIKLQISCFLITLLIAFKHASGRYLYSKKIKFNLFSVILTFALGWLFFDGLSAYTVARYKEINPTLNLLAHYLFFFFVSTTYFLICIYIFAITEKLPKTIFKWILLVAPYVICTTLMTIHIKEIEYIDGIVANYSRGFSPTICYVMTAIYFFLIIFTYINRWKFIEQNKKTSIIVFLSTSIILQSLQMIYPEILITSLACVIFILGIYLNHEDPAILKLTKYNSETVINFANLVENRDNNTGGHVKRTTNYVKLILKELVRDKSYKETLTKDYINNLQIAAPLHDIGKIGTPDAILQKPGKLTDEEYNIMKKHSENGGKIILESFSKLDDTNFTDIAFQVARYHHERWNGKGYPLGLKETEIPLSARIMAIADVFDAISQKRCYRDAIPLDTCFEIIKEGRGKDFDPYLTDIFLKIRPQVEKVYNASF